MKVIGLTGGIAMGKSTSAELLRQRAVPVIDTDDLARDIVAAGQPALAEVAAAFGKRLLDSTGSLIRSELARIVFSDPARLKQLETIVHPRIRELWLAQVARWRVERRPCGVVVIPLLYETSAQAHFDTILCTACSPATQLERLLKRGLSEEQARQRVAAQLPSEQKTALAHFVIWTEGDLDVHARQVSLILDRLGL